MTHGIVFLLFAGVLLWAGSDGPPLLWVFGYAALCFALAGLAHLTRRPAIFGKRDDGSLNPVSTIVFFPLRAVSSLDRWIRGLRRNEPYSEIADGLWLGERTNTLPPGIERIVDLTSEHSRVGPASAEYLLVPTLDGDAPDPIKMREVIARMIEAPRPTYVHCWAGRGRSATLVAAYLLQTKAVRTVDEAERLLRSKRSVVSLHAPQRDVCRTFETET